MIILGIDTATSTGWASGPPGAPIPAFGSFMLPKTGTDIGAFIVAFEDLLDRLIAVTTPDVVCFEAPLFLLRGNSNIVTARKLMGLTNEIERKCCRLGISRYEAHQQSHKKHFVGFTYTKKTKPYPAVTECLKRGILVENHDQADAVAIWSYCCSLLDPDHARKTDPLAAAAGGW